MGEIGGVEVGKIGEVILVEGCGGLCVCNGRNVVGVVNVVSCGCFLSGVLFFVVHTLSMQKGFVTHMLAVRTPILYESD